MKEQFFILISHSIDNEDKAILGFMIANEALKKGYDSIVFLAASGVQCALKETGNFSLGKPFNILNSLTRKFINEGGKLLVSSNCAKLRGININHLINGATSADIKDILNYLGGEKTVYL